MHKNFTHYDSIQHKNLNWEECRIPLPDENICISDINVKRTTKPIFLGVINDDGLVKEKKQIENVYKVNISLKMADEEITIFNGSFTSDDQFEETEGLYFRHNIISWKEIKEIIFRTQSNNNSKFNFKVEFHENNGEDICKKDRSHVFNVLCKNNQFDRIFKNTHDSMIYIRMIQGNIEYDEKIHVQFFYSPSNKNEETGQILEREVNCKECSSIFYCSAFPEPGILLMSGDEILIRHSPVKDKKDIKFSGRISYAVL